MIDRTADALALPRFTRDEWAALRADTPLTLTVEDLSSCSRSTIRSRWRRSSRSICRCRACSRFMSRRRRACSRRRSASLAPRTARCPISSALPARSRPASRRQRAFCRRCCRAGRTRRRSSSSPRMAFCIRTPCCKREGLMEKKGFPESYDGTALIRFLSDVKAGQHNVQAPVYSHLVYDVIPGESVIVDRPGYPYRRGPERPVAEPACAGWQGHSFRLRFLRFLGLSATPTESDLEKLVRRALHAPARDRFSRSASYFKKYAALDDAEAEATARDIWTRINLRNLRENILPTTPAREPRPDQGRQPQHRGGRAAETLRGRQSATPPPVPGTQSAAPRRVPGTPSAAPRHVPGTPRCRPAGTSPEPQGAVLPHVPGTQSAALPHVPGTLQRSGRVSGVQRRDSARSALPSCLKAVTSRCAALRLCCN